MLQTGVQSSVLLTKSKEVSSISSSRRRCRVVSVIAPRRPRVVVRGAAGGFLWWATTTVVVAGGGGGGVPGWWPPASLRASCSRLGWWSCLFGLWQAGGWLPESGPTTYNSLLSSGRVVDQNQSTVVTCWPGGYMYPPGHRPPAAP